MDILDEVLEPLSAAILLRMSKGSTYATTPRIATTLRLIESANGGKAYDPDLIFIFHVRCCITLGRHADHILTVNTWTSTTVLIDALTSLAANFRASHTAVVYYGMSAKFMESTEVQRHN